MATEPKDRTALVELLREMSLLCQLRGENAFKSRAYDTAADRIAGLTEELSTLVAEKRLDELPGIGPSIANSITEWVETGRISHHQELMEGFPPHILELLRIPDLGPKKVRALWEQLGVGTVEELEAACTAGRVQRLKGFGAKSEEKILAGVALYRRSQAGAPRKLLGHILPLAEELLRSIQQHPDVQRASLAGSARRGCETVGDVDLVASSSHPERVLAAFAQHPLVAQVLAQGGSKCSVRLSKGDLQVDLRVLPDEDFATALHHFTGSKAHHIRLRGLAQQQGLTLSEWGLFRVEQAPSRPADKAGTKRAAAAEARPELAGEKLRVRDEAELYRLLGMQEIPPELREDRGEIEAAQARALPDELVQLSDLRGNVHAHTLASDGKSSLEEMAAAARALGLAYLTVTEHSQSAGYAGGLTEDALRRQWDQIDALNETFDGFRLLKGIESDILEDGSLDYPERLLEKFDVVIGSLHSRFKMDEEAMTRRMLAALDNPYLNIWGHPTGRLIHQRAPAPLRMEEILDKAAKRGVVLEVNGQPERLDLKPEHVRLALERKLKLVVSTDAHSVQELAANLRLAVATARKGWARRSDILNTLDAEQFVRALRKLKEAR